MLLYISPASLVASASLDALSMLSIDEVVLLRSRTGSSNVLAASFPGRSRARGKVKKGSEHQDAVEEGDGGLRAWGAAVVDRGAVDVVFFTMDMPCRKADTIDIRGGIVGSERQLLRLAALLLAMESLGLLDVVSTWIVRR